MVGLPSLRFKSSHPTNSNVQTIANQEVLQEGKSKATKNRFKDKEQGQGGKEVSRAAPMLRFVREEEMQTRKIETMIDSMDSRHGFHFFVFTS